MQNTFAARRASDVKSPGTSPAPAGAVVEARLWMEEYDWLHGILKSGANVCPTFRFPDLISAAVSLCLSHPEGCTLIFRFLGSQLVLRAPDAARRRESIWRAQYEQLRALQRSPANRHPHPNFQLDQLTTACVALARLIDETGTQLLLQARLNMAERSRLESVHADWCDPAAHHRTWSVPDAPA